MMTDITLNGNHIAFVSWENFEALYFSMLLQDGRICNFWMSREEVARMISNLIAHADEIHVPRRDYLPGDVCD